MKKLTTFLLSAVLLGLPIAARAAHDLDNSSWRAIGAGDTAANDDHLVFVNGQFTSSACIPYGFTPGSYSSKKVGDVVQWTATQTNPDKSKMAWTGEIKGDKMTGSFVNTSKSGKTFSQQWEAEKLGAQAK